MAGLACYVIGTEVAASRDSTDADTASETRILRSVYIYIVVSAIKGISPLSTSQKTVELFIV